MTFYGGTLLIMACHVIPRRHVISLLKFVSDFLRKGAKRKEKEMNVSISEKMEGNERETIMLNTMFNLIIPT